MKGITNTADEDARPETLDIKSPRSSNGPLSPKDRKKQIIEKPAEQALNKIKSNNALVKH
jgi:hypothetical protein